METFNIVLQFAFATLLPVAVGAVLTKLSETALFKRMGYVPKQLLYGIVFGCIAIFGTEFGIKTHDATMNVRDAAPIVAGLYFGSPAGIIAGLIGGIERWFAALWGRGMFTRVACSVATAAAGIYVALLNRHLFDGRKPSWPLALAIGMVAEVLHLLLVFLTNMDDATHAFLVVQACSIPMIGCNAISVALAGAVIARMKGQDLHHAKGNRDISQAIQAGLQVVVAVCLVVTVGFTFVLQQNMSHASTVNTLNLEIGEVEADIHDASDANLLLLTYAAAEAIPTASDVTTEKLVELTKSLDVSEVHFIDAHGIISASSDDSYVGFDMHSGKQSSAFLDLLPSGRSSYFVQDYQPMTIDGNQWRKFAGVRIPGGFLQVSYDSSHFLDDIAAQVRASVTNRHVGKDGMFVVFDENGGLIGTRSDVSLTSSEIARIMSDARQSGNGSMFETSHAGNVYYAICQEVEGCYVVAMMPKAEALQSRDLSVIITSFMELLVFAALFVAIFVLIKHVVVRSIWEVNGTLNKITSGDLEAEVNVRDSAEFSSLSDDINRTVGALRQAIAAESARIERDLSTAKAIQESALPRTFPPFPDIDKFDIYASMNAAREVGGDFYDFFLIDDHTLGFLIADVSGKGIPASLFMMAAKSELANYIKSGMELAEAVHSANCNLCQGNDAGMFVTVWAATLNWETGELTYVNAGHNFPLLRHGTKGRWEWLNKKCGLFLGTFEMAKYRQEKLTLQYGDEILLYTDGVNEAFSASEEEYGNNRLETFLASHNNMHPHVLIDSLKADVRKWARGAEQSDDITMVCLEYGVPPEVSGSIRVKATEEGLDELRRFLHFELSQVQCPDHIQSQLDLTIEELFTNVCQHGYVGLPEPGDIEFAYVYSPSPTGIVASFTDWGEAFDPLSYEKPAEEKDVVKGLGIELALKNIDDISYVHDDDCNVIAFRKDW